MTALHRRAIADILVLAVATIGVWNFVRAITLKLPTTHVDGAFQTASALYRLASGELPGRDFFPYLGLGPVYAVFPIFRVMGGDLGTSNAAAHFAVLLAAAATVTLLLKLTLPILPSVRVYALSLIAMPILMVALNLAGASIFVQIYPGNSLRPLRSIAPYLAAAALFIAYARVTQPIRRVFLYGVVGGTILWWSNDFGLPAAILTAAFAVIDLAWNKQWRASHFVSAAMGALVAAPVSLFVLTGGQAVRLLRYNLVDVAHDQWWYFGPWNAERRVFSPADLTIIFGPGTLVALLVLAVALVWAVRRRDVTAFLLPLIGLVTFLGGLVASYGGHYQPEYLHPFQWWALIAGFCLLARAAQFDQNWLLRLPDRYAAGLVAGAVLLFATGAIAGRTVLTQRMERDRSVYHDAALGGFLDMSWRAYVERARTSTAPFVEEYWGIWSAVKHQNHGHVDSVIHALGSERSRFEHRIAVLPSLVVTSRPSITGIYQGWGLSVNWWFYAPILKNYRITATSPNTLIWRRAPQPDWVRTTCHISPDGSRLLIAAQPGDLLDIGISYQARLPSRSLLMVHNTLGMDNGWSPLDAAATSTRFPVLVSDRILAEGVQFKALPASLRRGQIVIKTCSASVVPRRQDATAVLPTRS